MQSGSLLFLQYEVERVKVGTATASIASLHQSVANLFGQARLDDLAALAQCACRLSGSGDAADAYVIFDYVSNNGERRYVRVMPGVCFADQVVETRWLYCVVDRVAVDCDVHRILFIGIEDARLSSGGLRLLLCEAFAALGIERSTTWADFMIGLRRITFTNEAEARRLLGDDVQAF